MLLTFRRLLGLYVFARCSEDTASKRGTAKNVEPHAGTFKKPCKPAACNKACNTGNKSRSLDGFHALSSFDMNARSVAHDLA